jgi:hypothetical protein
MHASSDQLGSALPCDNKYGLVLPPIDKLESLYLVEITPQQNKINVLFMVIKVDSIR